MSSEMNVSREYRSGRKNLLFATLISIPGPVALGISFIGGQSATQTADFLRRTCEFLSIFLAYVIFEITNRSVSENLARRSQLEACVRIFTGSSMMISAVVMVYLAVTSFGGEKGSVVTSLILAVIGAAVNAKLYLNYKTMRNAVLSVQAKLHRVKMLLDIWMVLLLLLWIFTPSAAVKNYTDLIGSCSIALYIVWSGFRVLRNR